ncbi:MAG: T9SS type A sorting domain-containing protein [Ignavibacteriae bacterium]|nr:T9SS type A sorting domain-containing protein [Ignavibacteriota bacterium]
MKNLIFPILLLTCLLLTRITVAQITLNNVRSYNGTLGADDLYSAIICDNSDNIYAAGYSSDGICSYIIFDKFNPSGTKLWSKTYRSRDNGYDVPVSIALDSTGGIYIAGYTKGITTSYDFLLIKYNQQGDTLWSRRYNGTANGDDRAIKVAVDRNNSAVLAGNAVETGESINIVLIKYDINGNQLWQKKYDGSGHTDDKVNDFTFDKNNYIYAAALTNSNLGSGRYYVMKITPSGDTVWTRTFGTADGAANAIITDDSLNVYATGKRYISSDTVSFFTVKLNSSGNQVWTSTYFEGVLHRDFAYRIAMDEQGSVYVAGELSSIILAGKIITTNGYAVVKYTNGGQQSWVYKFEKYSPSNPICHLKVLNSGSIYLAYTKLFMNDITTRSQCVKINSNGDSVWVKTIQGQYRFYGLNSFHIDKSGNLLFGSAANAVNGLDAALVKWNPSGTLTWERYLNSQNFSTDNALSIGKDSQNNIYVTGTNTMNYIFIKYNSSFTQQWAVTYSDGYTRVESSAFSTVDSSGNIYLAGVTNDSIDRKFILLLKYNTSGSLEWERKYLNNPAMPWGICLDKTGNIIIAGTNWDNYNHSALNLLKYSPSGTLLMTTSFNATNNSQIWIYSVDTDNDNNILVAGGSYGAMTWKFTTNGNLIWENYWVSNYVHSIHKLKYDRKNNVYVCGFTGTSSGYDYLTIKYDSAGNQKWAKTFNGIRSGEDFAEDLVSDTLGNTYITGYAVNQPATFERSIVTIKYDSTGNVLWLRDFVFPQNGYLQPVMLTRDKYNNIYILNGYNYHQPLNAGYLLLKYNSNGDNIWSFTYGSPIAKNAGKAFLLIGDDKIYVTGKAYGINTGYDITTLELAQTSGIRKIEGKTPTAYSLSQNYPNPFNPVTRIRYDLPRAGVVRLAVYDVMGREVEMLVNERQAAGSYEAVCDGTRFASGVYFYRLTAEGYGETRKMLLIR